MKLSRRYNEMTSIYRRLETHGRIVDVENDKLKSRIKILELDVNGLAKRCVILKGDLDAKISEISTLQSKLRSAERERGDLQRQKNADILITENIQKDLEIIRKELNETKRLLQVAKRPRVKINPKKNKKRKSTSNKGRKKRRRTEAGSN